jgi:hypothetical protein
MDVPTRVGLGGTALFTLAGVGAPIVTWWVSAPIMAACAGVAVWGFLPLIPKARQRGQRLSWFRQKPSDEVASFYNSWLYPAAENVHQVLQLVLHAIQKHPDYAVQTNGAMIQRIMDDERAALSGISNVLRGKEAADNLDFQDRIGAYYRAYQGCRTWISQGLKLTVVDLRGDPIFQEWLRLDEKFLDQLRQLSGPSRYDRLRELINAVGWGESITRDLRGNK